MLYFSKIFIASSSLLLPEAVAASELVSDAYYLQEPLPLEKTSTTTTNRMLVTAKPGESCGDKNDPLMANVTCAYYVIPEHYSMIDQVKAAQENRCTVTEKMTDEQRKSAKEFLHLASEYGKYQSYEDAVPLSEDPVCAYSNVTDASGKKKRDEKCVLERNALTSFTIMNSAITSPPVVVGSLWFSLIGLLLSYFCCICIPWCFPCMRRCRKERGHARLPYKILFFLFLGTIVFMAYAAVTISLAQGVQLNKSMQTMVCGFTTLLKSVIAGPDISKSAASADAAALTNVADSNDILKSTEFPGLISLMETGEQLRDTLLPNSKFIKDVFEVLDDTEAASKAVAMLIGSLSVIEKSFTNFDNKFGNPSSDLELSITSSKTMHDSMFAPTMVADAADSLARQAYVGAVARNFAGKGELRDKNADYSNFLQSNLLADLTLSGTIYSSGHYSMSAKAIATAISEMKKALGESTMKALEATLAEVKLQFMPGGKLDETRLQMEDGLAMMGEMMTEQVYQRIGPGAATDKSGSRNMMDPELDMLVFPGMFGFFAGVPFEQVWQFGTLVPFFLTVPTVLFALIAVLLFFAREHHSVDNGNHGFCCNKEKHGVLKDEIGREEEWYAASPGVCACVGYCTGSCVVLIIMLLAGICSTISFVMATSCEYVGGSSSPAFGAHKVNTTSLKWTGSPIDTMTGTMIDSCLLGKDNGMFLKGVMNSTCPAFKENGTFPESCAEEVKVRKSMDWVFREKTLGAIRGQFNKVDLTAPKLAEDPKVRVLMDLLDSDRLGSVIPTTGNFRHKFFAMAMLDSEANINTNKSTNTTAGAPPYDYTSTFAMGMTMTSLSCFDTSLPAGVKENLPSFAPYNLYNSTYGLISFATKAFIDRGYWKHVGLDTGATAYTGDATTAAARKSGAVTPGTEKFVDEELFDSKISSTCGIYIPTTCDPVKTRTADNPPFNPYDDNEYKVKNSDFHWISVCKSFFTGFGDQNMKSETSEAGIRYKRLKSYYIFGITYDAAKFSEDKAYFFGGAYECRPCEAGINMLKMKLMLRNFVHGEKAYIEFNMNNKADNLATPPVTDNENKTQFQNNMDFKTTPYPISTTAEFTAAQRTAEIDFTAFSGCDLANLKGERSGFNCLQKDTNSAKTSKNPFFVKSTTYTYEAHKTKLANNIVNSIDGAADILKGSRVYPSWSLGSLFDKFKITDSTDIATRLASVSTSRGQADDYYINNGTTKVISSYAAAMFDRALERFDGETGGMGPKIVGDGKKSGLSGLLEHNFLSVIEKEFLDKASCAFVPSFWNSALDGICYLAVPAAYILSLNLAYSCFAQILLIILCYFIWRWVRDNIEMKRKRRRRMIKMLKLKAEIDGHEEEAKVFEKLSKEDQRLIVDPKLVGEESAVKWLRNKTHGHDNPQDKPYKIAMRKSIDKIKQLAALEGGWKKMAAELAEGEITKGKMSRRHPKTMEILRNSATLRSYYNHDKSGEQIWAEHNIPEHLKARYSAKGDTSLMDKMIAKVDEDLADPDRKKVDVIEVDLENIQDKWDIDRRLSATYQAMGQAPAQQVLSEDGVVLKDIELGNMEGSTTSDADSNLNLSDAVEQQQLSLLNLRWNRIKASEQRLLVHHLPDPIAKDNPSVKWLAAEPPHTSAGKEALCRVRAVTEDENSNEVAYVGVLEYVNETTGAVILDDAEMDLSSQGISMSFTKADDKRSSLKGAQASESSNLIALKKPTDVRPVFSDKDVNKHLHDIVEEYDDLVWEACKDSKKREELHQILDKVEHDIPDHENDPHIEDAKKHTAGWFELKHEKKAYMKNVVNFTTHHSRIAVDLQYGRLYDDKVLAKKMDGTGYIFLSDEDLRDHLEKFDDLEVEDTKDEVGAAGPNTTQPGSSIEKKSSVARFQAAEKKAEAANHLANQASNSKKPISPSDGSIVANEDSTKVYDGSDDKNEGEANETNSADKVEEDDATVLENIRKDPERFTKTNF